VRRGGENRGPLASVYQVEAAGAAAAGNPIREVLRMNAFKILFALVMLILAVVGGFVLFGMVAWLFKYLIFFGVLALVGAVAYKALKKGDARETYQLGDSSDSDLARADRILEEMRRKQLTK
jgi:hypothetical protein